MSVEDPIVDAKTVAAMMAAIDQRFHLQLPFSFSPGSLLDQLWKQAIEVTKDPQPGVLYLGNGTTPFPITVIPGAVCVRVTSEPATPAAPRPGP